MAVAVTCMWPCEVQSIELVNYMEELLIDLEHKLMLGREVQRLHYEIHGTQD